MIQLKKSVLFVFVLNSLNVFGQSDMDRQRSALNDLKPVFQAVRSGKDSAFVCLHSDWHYYQVQDHIASTLPTGCENLFACAHKGDVIGPCDAGNELRLYKVLDKFQSADSVRVRHLLIAYSGVAWAGNTVTRTKEQAKTLADSLLNVVKKKKTKLEDLILPFTDDPGSRGGNLGDYGWFTRESNFIKEFQDAGFDNNKGDVVLIETQFGYHIIQVLDKSEPEWNYRLCYITRFVNSYQGIFLMSPNDASSPLFPGDENALSNYMKSNMQYPQKAKAEKREGVVWVYAYVDKNGSIINYASINGIPAAPEFTIEAIRLIASMPKWIPGTGSGGHPVECQIAIPVVFCLSCDN